MNALSYVNIDQGIHKGRSKVAQSEKGKKLPNKLRSNDYAVLET